MELQEIGWQGSNWLDLAHGRDKWQALVYAIKDLRIPLNAGKFLTEELIAPQEGLFSVELVIMNAPHSDRRRYSVTSLSLPKISQSCKLLE